MTTRVYQSDCLDILKSMQDETVDLVYMDPPFFTQTNHKLSPRTRDEEFSFSDMWNSASHYAEFLHARINEMHRILRLSGSLFFHCDRTASHIARLVLDDIFDPSFFQSEIIWQYRRWSNSKKSLMPSHQTILFYSKSKDLKFNVKYIDYSPSTNVDQILQKRGRDEYNKSVYARDESGDTIPNGHKKGVPLGDVWDIPFLNPKAKERTGYPTQKPVLLLETIIELATNENDLVLDPFCGSGTTLVAAELLGRNSIGVDISQDAVNITNQRLSNPMKTSSRLLQVGRSSYDNANEWALAQLTGLDAVPVHRNNGIDAILKDTYKGGPVPVRVQRPGETLGQAASALHKASASKHSYLMVLISTQEEFHFDIQMSLPPEIVVVDSTTTSIRKLVSQLKQESATRV
ncbi:MAG: site-specific DNA-methyltransferase [Planctomycetes bacterium]|nr:site-specific DNA-methyltransferase [Planctomycetota bacterium]